MNECSRMREYASIGAGHAATAIARLVQRVVIMRPARCRRLELAEIAASLYPPDTCIAAVFVDLGGKAGGQAGLLIEREAVGSLLRELVGSELRATLDPLQLSALSELGNIALSAAASAWADLQSSTVLPSVPWVGFDMAGALLLEAVHEHLHEVPIWLMDATLEDRESRLGARFLWVPTR